jgi:hypothetical protein
MKDRRRKHQQGRAAMPFPDLVINGHTVPIVRSVSNPLTREACERYSLESVDNDIIHTRLRTLQLPAVSSITSALIYYIPTKLDLSQPIVASVGLRACLKTCQTGQATDHEMDHRHTDHGFAALG